MPYRVPRELLVTFDPLGDRREPRAPGCDYLASLCVGLSPVMADFACRQLSECAVESQCGPASQPPPAPPLCGVTAAPLGRAGEGGDDAWVLEEFRARARQVRDELLRRSDFASRSDASKRSMTLDVIADLRGRLSSAIAELDRLRSEVERRR